MERFELYQIMAGVFFDRISKEEKIDALIEVISILNIGKSEE